MSMLQTPDLMKSAQAAMEKKNLKEVTFSKLWESTHPHLQITASLMKNTC